MLAEKAQRRWIEELEHEEQLRNMHTLHAAALQQAHQAQVKHLSALLQAVCPIDHITRVLHFIMFPYKN